MQFHFSKKYKMEIFIHSYLYNSSQNFMVYIIFNITIKGWNVGLLLVRMVKLNIIGCIFSYLLFIATVKWYLDEIYAIL